MFGDINCLWLLNNRKRNKIMCFLIKGYIITSEGDLIKILLREFD